ncbi:citrate lyase subunit beta / citryl-CoA lyase [Microbacterium sp. LKL04]|uniref:HpcH/HpaI aldolase/citrate lyase family protein n=1 Tax=Microbacterium sp. LKL04 TaxID=912630 RepID=UPI000875E502|nr:CoA ester lyase [Microbacterium sp. LKL04]SCY65950.1 citrate lyase subunit beta / citryl-CoA lyase [Microbacterium sp. LKL04]
MSLGPALLFCPADRPERYAKALAVADAVILDLEDAVAPADKAGAREALAAADVDAARVIVRVNPASTPELERDLAALQGTGFRRLMLAKAEETAEVDGLDGYRVIALCETPRGVENAGTLARHPLVDGLMWGAEDLIAGIGGRSSRFEDGRYRDVARYARSRVLIAAAVAGIDAVDAVHLDITDTAGLEDEARDAAASGFAATACIHPSQVEVIRRAYAATPEELEWADAVLDEATRQPGVFRFRGQMIDEPVLRQARRALSR